LVAHLLKVAGAIYVNFNRSRPSSQSDGLFSFVLCGVPPASLVRGPDEQDPFFLPAQSEYRTARGLEVARSVEHFTGGTALDRLIDRLDSRRGVVLSSGTTVPGRYESFDLGFSDPPLRLESTGTDFFIEALNERGKVLIAFLAANLNEPCVVITDKSATRISGHIARRCAGGRGSAHPARFGRLAGARHYRVLQFAE
jgi:hypothetical protein